MQTATLTACEVARRLNVSPRTVYPMLEAGQLHGVRAGRLWRVTEEALDEYLRVRRHSNGDDDQLSPEDLDAIRDGLAAIQRGEWVTLDEYERQRQRATARDSRDQQSGPSTVLIALPNAEYEPVFESWKLTHTIPACRSHLSS